MAALPFTLTGNLPVDAPPFPDLGSGGYV